MVNVAVGVQQVSHLKAFFLDKIIQFLPLIFFITAGVYDGRLPRFIKDHVCIFAQRIKSKGLNVKHIPAKVQNQRRVETQLWPGIADSKGPFF